MRRSQLKVRQTLERREVYHSGVGQAIATEPQDAKLLHPLQMSHAGHTQEMDATGLPALSDLNLKSLDEDSRQGFAASTSTDLSSCHGVY
jgi:hypothetical protein